MDTYTSRRTLYNFARNYKLLIIMIDHTITADYKFPTCAIWVVDIMIDVCCAASCTWPSSTQPTLCTLCCSSNPVQSVTPGSGGACLLARLEGCCSVSLTVGIVCVHLWSSPQLACYRRTVALSNSNTRANFIYFRMYQNTSNIKQLWDLCTVKCMKLNLACQKHLKLCRQQHVTTCHCV